MGAVSSTGRSTVKGGRRKARTLLCLAVSAMALMTILAPMITAGDSSADTVDNNLHMDLYDDNGQILTSPLMNGAKLVFNTTTTPDGVVYELENGVPIDSIPAYFLIRTDTSGAGYGLFKVTVKIHDLDGTWMQNFGIRVSTSDGSTADLSSNNSFEMMFQKGGVDSSFEMNKRYYVSFSTLSGSHILDTAPGTIGNFTIEFIAEPIADYHNVEYYSDSNLVEIRLLRDFDTIGPFPNVQSKGRDPIGWIDYDGNIVDEDTYVSELQSYMILAIYEWPVIIEKQTEYVDAEGNDITEKLRKEIYEDGHYIEDTSKKVEDKDGNVKEETSHKEKDSDDTTREYDTQTDITKHDDGTETHNTATETKVNGNVTETSETRTEYDSEKTMVEEELTLKVYDPGTGEAETYNVVTSLIDERSVEKKYMHRVETEAERR